MSDLPSANPDDQRAEKHNQTKRGREERDEKPSTDLVQWLLFTLFTASILLAIYLALTASR